MNQTATQTQNDNEDIIQMESRNGLYFQVVNPALVPTKMLALLTIIMDCPSPANGAPLPHLVRNVCFIGGKVRMPNGANGKPMLGAWSKETRTIVIDVDSHLEHTKNIVKKPHGILSIRAEVWLQMLLSIGHELTHAHFDHAEEVIGIPKSVDEENIVERNAQNLLYFLTQRVDIEPPAEEEWVGPLSVQLLIEENKTVGANEPWQALQSMIRAGGLVGLVMGNSPIEFKTLDEYLRWASKTDRSDWSKAPRKHMELEITENKAPVRGKLINHAAELAKEKAIHDEVERRMKEREETIKSLTDSKGKDVIREIIVALNLEKGRSANDPVTADEIQEALSKYGLSTEAVLEGIAKEVRQSIDPQPQQKEVNKVYDYSIENDPYATADLDEHGNIVGLDHDAGIDPMLGNADPTPTLVLYQRRVESQKKALGPPTLPVFPVDVVQARKTIYAVWMALYTHMFNKCGWGPEGYGLPYKFENPTGVREPVFVGNIPEVERYIVSMTYTNQEGRWCPNRPLLKSANGVFIMGTTSKGGLPKYELVINLGDGFGRKRMLLAQNLDKKYDDGTLKSTAKHAREGHRIAWVIDQDKPMGASGSFILKIADGSIIDAKK